MDEPEPGPRDAPPEAGTAPGRSPGVSRWRRVARIALALVLAGIASAALLGLYSVIVVVRAPSVAGLPERGDPGPSAFMARDGCSEQRRTYVDLDALDPTLVCAVVWGEDWRFFQHGGVDWGAFEDALASNWERGELHLGGSTIPMQLARNLFLSRERTPSRKLRELVLAPRLVERYGRARVLELYLNAAEWAPCVYGAQAAARHYLGHDADHVDPAEAAFLASMLPRPGRPPGADPDRRQRTVRHQQALITRMGRAGLLSSGVMRRARAEVFVLMSPSRLDAGARERSDQGLEPAWSEHRPITRMPAPSDWLEGACGTLVQSPAESPEYP